ncbi:MAG: MarR family winged helix-turn-helix transcriptional regulator [Bryobacteraceae bacterium]
MKRHGVSKEKKQRAWGAYLELTETANWIEAKLRTPLGVFGVTREEFRLMIVLYRDGPQRLIEVETKLRRSRQSLSETIERLEEFGWVSRGVKRLPPAEVEQTRLPKEKRGKERFGPQVGMVSLTEQGERLVGNLLPKQEEIVRSLMGALDGRELESLTRICRKLRRDDMLPFWFEVMRQGREFEESGEAEEV